VLIGVAVTAFLGVRVLFANAIFGTKPSETSVVKQYEKNADEIKSIADFINNFDRPEDEEFEHLEFTLKQTLECYLYTPHNKTDVTGRIDEKYKEEITTLFYKSKFCRIYDAYPESNCVVFETESEAWKIYSGVIVTKDGNPPDCKFAHVREVKKIDEAVYYFEAE
jgi:hypothetical protein